jgi:hypothetical protein
MSACALQVSQVTAPGVDRRGLSPESCFDQPAAQVAVTRRCHRRSGSDRPHRPQGHSVLRLDPLLDLLGESNVGPKSVADLERALAEWGHGPEDPLSCLALPRPLGSLRLGAWIGGLGFHGQHRIG